MKINWGIGIVIGMVLFISFIMVMVIIMITDEKYDHQMVTDSYYEKGMVYQEEIDAETNTKSLSADLMIQKTELGWLMVFPQEVNQSVVDGSVEMYRPSNEKLDFSMPLKLQGNQMLIPKEKLIEGQWKISVYWKMGNKPFLYKKELTY